MHMASSIRNARFPLLAFLAMTLCWPGLPMHAQGQAARTDTVIIDGHPVSAAGHQNLLAVLLDYTRARRIGITARDTAQQPLVIVDSLPLAVPALAAIDIAAVASVTVLGPRDAAWRYGPRAKRGAVVIQMKRARRSVRSSDFARTHPPVDAAPMPVTALATTRSAQAGQRADSRPDPRRTNRIADAGPMQRGGTHDRSPDDGG